MRLERLNQLARILASDHDLDRIVQTVTDTATELTAAKFGAFFYNVTNEAGESYMLYTLSGAPRSAFEHFGMPRNTAVFDPTFRGAEIVRSDDIRTDARYGHNAPHFGMPRGHLPVVSYLAAPVVGRSGEVLGGLFFGHDEPGVFLQDTEDLVAGIAAHAAIAVDNARLHKAARDELVQRRSAEEAKDFLLNELQHRVKNTLSTVQAVAAQTFRSAPREQRDAFNARMQSLAGAHLLLTERDRNRAEVRAVVEHALEPFRDSAFDRYMLFGANVTLDGPRSLTLSMILHELATNAGKYGALSNDTGTISVSWEVDDASADARLRLTWQESGGPTVTPPKRKGFGSTLIERSLQGAQGKASFEYHSAGLICLIEVAL
jgi:two-component sensor histidine kinase